MAGTSKPDAPALSLKFRQLPPEVSKKLGTGPRSMTPQKGSEFNSESSQGARKLAAFGRVVVAFPPLDLPWGEFLGITVGPGRRLRWSRS